MTYPVAPYFELKAHLRKSGRTDRLCRLRMFFGESNKRFLEIGFKPEYLGYYYKGPKHILRMEYMHYKRQWREVEKGFNADLWGLKYYGLKHSVFIAREAA